MTQAFPLQWPEGQPRRQATRTDSAFRVAPTAAFEEMMDELARFGAKNVVVSSNIPIRRDGTPYRDGLQELLEDPGVAVYFAKGQRQVCLPCDSYRRPWENCRAISKAIESLRAMERHGAHQILDRAFHGFMALPSPGVGQRHWWAVLGLPQTASRAQIQAAWREKVRHADDAEKAALNVARDAGFAATT